MALVLLTFYYATANVNFTFKLQVFVLLNFIVYCLVLSLLDVQACILQARDYSHPERQK